MALTRLRQEHAERRAEAKARHAAEQARREAERVEVARLAAAELRREAGDAHAWSVRISEGEESSFAKSSSNDNEGSSRRQRAGESLLNLDDGDEEDVHDDVSDKGL